MTSPDDKASAFAGTAASSTTANEAIDNKSIKGPAAFLDNKTEPSKNSEIEQQKSTISGIDHIDRIITEAESGVGDLVGKNSVPENSVSISPEARKLARAWSGLIRSAAVARVGEQLRSGVSRPSEAPASTPVISPTTSSSEPSAPAPQATGQQSAASPPDEQTQSKDGASERKHAAPAPPPETPIEQSGKDEGTRTSVGEKASPPALLPPIDTMSGSANGITSVSSGTGASRGIDLSSFPRMSTTFSRAMPPVVPPAPAPEPEEVRLHEAELAEVARIEPRLAAELLINQVAHAPNAVKAKTLREAVPVILRNAAARRNDGELLADIGIKALTSVSSTSGFSLPVLSVLPAVRAKLELKAPAERNKGWLESLSNIAVIATSASDEMGEGHESFLNATIVAALAYQDALNWMGQSREQFHPSVMRIAGNNLSVALRKYKRVVDLKDPGGQIENVASKLAALAGGAAVDVVDGKAVPPVVLETLGLSFPVEDQPAVIALIDTNPRLVEDKDSYAVSYAHASQGVIRVAQRNERHVAPPFFNAGITLLSMPNRKTIEGTLARIALNAMGLYFVLEFSNRQETALGTNDGLDCLVNFGGALVEFMDQVRRDQDAMRRLFGERASAFTETAFNIIIFGRAEAQRLRKFEDFARLMASSERLKIHNIILNSETLAANVTKLCNIVSDYYANPFHDVDKTDTVQMAIWAGKMVRSIHGTLTDDLQTEIAKFQQDITASLAAVRDPWQALVDSGLTREPAFVKTKILTQAQWDEFHTFFTRKMANTDLAEVFAQADWPRAD